MGLVSLVCLACDWHTLGSGLGPKWSHKALKQGARQYLNH